MTIGANDEDCHGVAFLTYEPHIRGVTIRGIAPLSMAGNVPAIPCLEPGAHGSGAMLTGRV